VETAPDQCLIVIDGKEARRAPLSVTLRPGVLSAVEVACPKRPWSQQVLAVPGQSILLSVPSQP